MISQFMISWESNIDIMYSHITILNAILCRNDNGNQAGNSGMKCTFYKCFSFGSDFIQSWPCFMFTPKTRGYWSMLVSTGNKT